jgi:phospholipase C
MATPNRLTQIEHFVVVILENRSFDHMLGYLYASAGNKSPTGQAFDGLTGNEYNMSETNTRVSVYPITPNAANAYLMPGANPGEGYASANMQLFGATAAPTPPVANNSGFVVDFAQAIVSDQTKGWKVVAGTTSQNIMGMFEPDTLPVLSGLAKGYAVCDRWFASVPSETMPNRAFALAGTSQGHMDDATKVFTCPSVFGRLTDLKASWKIYGYTSPPLTRLDYPDVTNAPRAHFGLFADFKADAANGSLPGFAFLEPSWGNDAGNSEHPVGNVADGEQFIYDVYRAVRAGPAWEQTLLIVTYDEHGGCYDHVPPPDTATPPDPSAGQFGFDFKRFGVRVPTVLVSPLITAGSVFRATNDDPPLDHTSLLASLRARFGFEPLTARDSAAPDVGAVLTETQARTDDPLSGTTPPAAGTSAGGSTPSEMLRTHAELAAALPLPGARQAATRLGSLRTTADFEEFMSERMQELDRTTP